MELEDEVQVVVWKGAPSQLALRLGIDEDLLRRQLNVHALRNNRRLLVRIDNPTWHHACRRLLAQPLRQGAGENS